MLEERKAQDVQSVDVSRSSDFTDHMVIATGTSGRHVRALVQHVLDGVRAIGVKPGGVEGLDAGDWVLLDLGDVVVHVMQDEARGFYDLERLWFEMPADSTQSGSAELEPAGQ